MTTHLSRLSTLSAALHPHNHGGLCVCVCYWAVNLHVLNVISIRVLVKINGPLIQYDFFTIEIKYIYTIQFIVILSFHTSKFFLIHSHSYFSYFHIFFLLSTQIRYMTCCPQNMIMYSAREPCVLRTTTFVVRD